MKIIIPMAGMGKRMRPHTLTIPKPLIPVAGKPIVHHLVEKIGKLCNSSIEEIAFVCGRFGKETEDRLLQIAASVGSKGRIYYQDEALGTGHAVLCAADSLNGKIIVAFADTLFYADFVLNEEQDGVIWVHEVENPSAFGVVKINQEKIITDFVEKPKEYVSNLAIIGIYYFRDGENLKSELQYLIDQNIVKSGEYQLTDALQNMKNKGIRFGIGTVEEWLDCGNKDATVETNKALLKRYETIELPQSVKLTNSEIIQPCLIGENCQITNSKIGPYVSVGNSCKIDDSIIINSIIQSESIVAQSEVKNSMIGNHCEIRNNKGEFSISDYSTVK